MNKYIDIDRLEVNKLYKEFLENTKEDIDKNIEILEDIIEKDPDFFDSYLTLHDYYVSNSDLEKASKILGRGYERVLKLIIKDDIFPDELLWSVSQNRHIINFLFNYATFLWTVGEYESSLYIFMQLLKADIVDTVGARYSILAILEGYENIDNFEEEFNPNNRQLRDDWFNKNVQNHKQLLGWWVDEN